MARPQKHTVDYFSHDANASQGKTLSILFNNFGHEGISAWWQLLEIISNTENHVIGIGNPEELEYLAAKMRFQPDRLKNILTKMADMEAIDVKLFEAGFIWSQNFVNRLESVYRIRKQNLPLRPELSGKETALSGKETRLSTLETPQSKLKETKVNNIKKNKEEIQRKNYGEFNNVLLSDEEYKKLIVRFGEVRTKELIESLSEGIKSKGYKYKDFYATILTWSRRDGRTNGQSGQNHQGKGTGSFRDSIKKPVNP